MKTLLAVLVMGSVMAAGPAMADPFRSGFHIQDRGGFSHPKGGGKSYVKEAPPQRYAPPPPKGGNSRLTDDERRQLHRDLDKANRELYRGRRDR